LLQSGYDLYEAGQDAETVIKLDEFLSDSANSSRADEAFYLRGMVALRRNDLERAKSDLKKAVSHTRNKQLRGRARVGLGDIAFAQGDTDLSEKRYRQGLTHLERSDQLSGHAHYRLGCLLQRKGLWDDADAHFDRVLYVFAGTELAERAARRTHCVTWTIRTGVFGENSIADAEAKELCAKDFAGRTDAMILDGELVFAVQVGKFPTRQEAITELEGVRRLRGRAAVVPTR